MPAPAMSWFAPPSPPPLDPLILGAGWLAWLGAAVSVGLALWATRLMWRRVEAGRAAAQGALAVGALLVGLGVAALGYPWLWLAVLFLGAAGVAAGAWTGLGCALCWFAARDAWPEPEARATYRGIDLGAASSLPAVALFCLVGHLEHAPVLTGLALLLLVCGAGTGAALGALWWPLHRAFAASEPER